MSFLICNQCGLIFPKDECQCEIQIDGDYYQSCPGCLSDDLEEITEEMREEQDAKC